MSGDLRALPHHHAGRPLDALPGLPHRDSLALDAPRPDSHSLDSPPPDPAVLDSLHPNSPAHDSRRRDAHDVESPHPDSNTPLPDPYPLDSPPPTSHSRDPRHLDSPHLDPLSLDSIRPDPYPLDSPPPTSHSRDPRADAQLRPLVAHPWPTLESTLTGLRRVDAWGQRHRDLRGVFATAYVVVTVAIADARRRGDFADPEWIERLVVDFADRYRLALAGRAPLGPRSAWAPALARHRGGSLAALLALLHGMIAHVHFDLPHSLRACAPLGPRRRADYQRLGARICGATGEVQRAILAAHAPALAPLHASLRGADTRLTAAVLHAWRDRALDLASRMTAPASSRLARECAALSLAVDLAAWPLERALERLLHAGTGGHPAAAP